MSKSNQRLHSNNWPVPRQEPRPEAINLPNIPLWRRDTTQQQLASVTQLRKGDIAPQNYDLMSVRNTGRINLDFFATSPFAFSIAALTTLLQPHFVINVVPQELIFDPKNPISLDGTPNSAR